MKDSLRLQFERLALRLSELYTRLDKSVWSELNGASEIPALRRELQREHVNRVAR